MSKTVIITRCEGEETPLQRLANHDGYCDGVADVLQDFREMKKYGREFKGAWRVTIEKVSPKVVSTWRKAALKE